MEIEKVVVEQPDPFSPPAVKLEKSGTDDLILGVLRELKISYPNEIAAQTGFSQQTVLARLAFMRVHGLVERVVILSACPDDLKVRLEDLWAAGLKGSQIRRCAWHRLVNHGESEAK